MFGKLPWRLPPLTKRAGLAADAACQTWQLAADAAYVENILAGLGVPADARLAQLSALLTVSAAELPALVVASQALPDGFPAAIAAKRGAPQTL